MTWMMRRTQSHVGLTAALADIKEGCNKHPTISSWSCPVLVRHAFAYNVTLICLFGLITWCGQLHALCFVAHHTIIATIQVWRQPLWKLPMSSSVKSTSAACNPTRPCEFWFSLDRQQVPALDLEVVVHFWCPAFHRRKVCLWYCRHQACTCVYQSYGTHHRSRGGSTWAATDCFPITWGNFLSPMRNLPSLMIPSEESKRCVSFGGQQEKCSISPSSMEMVHQQRCDSCPISLCTPVSW